MSYNNVIIRTLYASGFSSLAMSFFRSNLTFLTFGFAPYAGKDGRGFDRYDGTQYASTTVDYEGAAALYMATKSILDGNESPIQLVLQRGHQTTLTFKCEPDDCNQMRTYLILDKNGKTIPFRFKIQQYWVKENGRTVTKIIQSGLTVFMKTLEIYLTAVDDSQFSSKFQG